MFLEIGPGVVNILGLGQRVAGLRLLRSKVLRAGGLGHCVQGHFDVVAVAVLVELYVGDLLVAHNGGVVRGHVAREFREVRRHILTTFTETDKVNYQCSPFIQNSL